MSELVFFKRGNGLAIGDVVELSGARMRAGASQVGLQITDIAAPDRAGPRDVTFADAKTDANVLRRLQAGACFVSDAQAAAVPSAVIALIVEDPYRAFVGVAARLYPGASRPSSLFETRGVAASAQVHPSARVEAGVTIDPAAVIGPRAEVGAGTLIGPMVAIGPDVRIGRDCSIGAGASVTNALLGDRVVIQPGCRIGHLPDDDSSNQFDHSFPGRVILQDKVRVGANGVIERGRHGDTVVGEASQVEALARIPADAMIGRYCTIMTEQASGYRESPGGLDVPFEDGLKLLSSQVLRATASGVNGYFHE
jgi:UDP-3-O-[3-hydroxymyristoyl] glucosamine N-acyltransferase